MRIARSMRIFNAIRLGVFIIVFVLFFQATVFSLNFRWAGREGDWSDRDNWSVRKVPDSFYHLAIIPDGNATIDADRFKLESLYVVTGERSMGDGSLSIINGGNLDVKQYVMVNALSGTSLLEVGQDSTLNARIHTMIAPTGRGVLNVTDGGFYKANLLNIGNTLDSNAKITVSGHGSRLAANIVSLGSGEVQIDINNGGKLLTDRFFCETSPGKTTVTVSGPNSHFKSKEIWWQSNDTGTALLNVKEGGYMNTDLLYIDTLSGSDSKVTISGGGHFEAQKAHIGYTKNGTLNIEDRAFVDIKYFTIGDHFDSNGTVTVKGPGTKLLAGENAKIGCRGEGTVNIINGATMKSGKLMVGFLKGKGNVLVSGQGSFLETREAFIGAYFDGEGFLNITDGGFMSTDLFFLGLRLDSTGSAIISGPESSLKARKAWIGYGEEGILNILDGGYMRSEEFKVGDGFYKDEEGVHARGTVTVSGHGSLLETENTVIGSEGQGKLSVVNGGFLRSSDLIAGKLNGSFGGITVSGPGSRVESKDVWIGNLGSGTLHVEENALMTSEHLFIGLGPGKSGTVTVSDLDSRFETESVQIGISGQGALHITDGGRMVSGEIIAGRESGGRGIATVSGQNSLIQTNASTIGAAGEGRLDIADGGRVMTKNVIIGSEPGVRDMGYTNTVTVTGPGAVLESESAAIGYYGKGVLDIVDGGNMRNQGRVVAGYLSGSSGIVSVSGKGSRLESVAAQIGYYSQGTLDITGGGTVHLTNLELGKFPAASGTATVSGIGSRLEAEATYIGNEGEGILNITEGGQVYTKLFSYGQDPDSTGSVTVSGPGSLLDTRTAWINFGFNRKLEIRDGGQMSSGTLEIRGSAIKISGQDSLLSSRQGILGPDAAISVTDGGEIRFEQSFEIGERAALVVSDGGRFTMEPDGFFNISSPGATASFTDMAAFDGHVHVNGSLSAPSVVFSSGSRLTGRQGVIHGDVTLHGTLSPGGANDPVSSPGTLVIDGNYTHEKDSRYVAGIDLDNQVSDRVEVSGSTTLNGGTIEAAWTGHVNGEERFTVLTSGSIEGDFDTLAGNTALVKLAVEKTSESVDIVLTRTDYADVTVNQKGLATQANQDTQKTQAVQETQGTQDNRNTNKLPNALDDLSPKAGKDMYQVLAALDRMTDSDQILSAYDQMTPSVIAGALAVNLDTLRQIGDLTGRRAASLRSKPAHPSDTSLYIHPIGSVSYRGGDHDHPAYRAGTAGIVTGIEKRSGSFFTGARGIYASSNIRWKDPGRSSSRADMASVGFYGGYLADTWELYASVDAGGLFYDTRRRMVFGGINRTASASPDGHLFAAQLGGSLDVDLGWSLLRPWASLRYARLTRNDYTEKGAGDLNLTVSVTEVDSLRSTLGLTLSVPGFTLGNTGGRTATGVNITPSLHAAWYHEFMGQNRFGMVSQLTGGGRPFTTTQAIRDADLFGFGPGLDLDITDTVSGHLRYEGILGDTSMNHNIYAGIAVRF